MKKLFMMFVLLSLYMIGYSINDISKEEILEVNWPDEYNWKILSEQEIVGKRFVEIIPENEDKNNWTILGTMISMKMSFDLDSKHILQMYKELIYAYSKKSKFTLLEKNDFDPNVWITFKVETESYPNDPKPESQVYYVVKGNESLYTVIVAVKEASLTDAFVDKWTKIFKESKLVIK